MAACRSRRGGLARGWARSGGPAFMAMMSLLIAWLRSRGMFLPKWTPRIADPDRINRGGMIAGLVGIAHRDELHDRPAMAGRADARPICARAWRSIPSFLQNVHGRPWCCGWSRSRHWSRCGDNGRHTSLTRRLELCGSLGLRRPAGLVAVRRQTSSSKRRPMTGHAAALRLVIAFILIDVAVEAVSRSAADYCAECESSLIRNPRLAILMPRAGSRERLGPAREVSA